eukprot:SAG22_NODE_28_length_28728_cov_19.603619_1_plen_69_part_00
MVPPWFCQRHGADILKVVTDEPPRRGMPLDEAWAQLNLVATRWNKMTENVPRIHSSTQRVGVNFLKQF